MPATSAIGSAQAGRSRSERAFTLVELMVVLAIVALIAASLPLALNRLLPARRAALAADRLVADVRWLQIQSSSTGAPAQLTLTSSGYRLEAGGHGGPRDVTLAKSTRLSLRARNADRPLPQLVIYPDGTASPARLQIADSGRNAVIEIGMLTGSARRTR